MKTFSELLFFVLLCLFIYAIILFQASLAAGLFCILIIPITGIVNGLWHYILIGLAYSFLLGASSFFGLVLISYIKENNEEIY